MNTKIIIKNGGDCKHYKGTNLNASVGTFLLPYDLVTGLIECESEKRDDWSGRTSHKPHHKWFHAGAFNFAYFFLFLTRREWDVYDTNKKYIHGIVSYFFIFKLRQLLAF